jgi:hypothetical protein
MEGDKEESRGTILYRVRRAWRPVKVRYYAVTDLLSQRAFARAL